MQKIFLLFSVIFLCSSVSGAQPPDNGALVHLNSQEVDKLIKEGEVTLRKIKVEHVHRERKQHVRKTQREYEEALNLYRQRRISLAKEALSNVEDSMADYKSTDVFLRNIYQRTLERLKRKMRMIRMVNHPELVDNLAQEAVRLQQQTEALGEDKNTAVLKKKLTTLRQVMEKLKQKKMAASQKAVKELAVQEQLDRIDQKADNFDREIFKLTQSKNYPEAKKKYADFRRAMIDELVVLKQTMAQAE